MPVTIPPAVLTAVASCSGRITLVIGAGCSLEPPTEIPLSRDISLRAHEHLVDNEVIPPDACDQPDDLSALADTVVAETGNQRALVSILPRADFRSAEPNKGYLCAAALLREGALADVITLNFDLALSNAVTSVGGRVDITIIPGPEGHADLGRSNVIYLHRNVECANFDDWILTRKALASAWADDRWETVVVRRAVSVPVVVFAGLGSRADVLERSIEQIRQAVSNKVFLVQPGSAKDSEFFEALGLQDDEHIDARWGEFMEALAARVALDQRKSLLGACGSQTDAEGWTKTSLVAATALLNQLDLLGLGGIRADFILDNRRYTTARNAVPEHVADLLLVIDLIAETLGCTPTLHAAGLVAFFDENGHRKGILGFASGRGIRSRLSLEPEIAGFRALRGVGQTPVAYVVAGVSTWEGATAMPTDVVAEPDEDSLITGGGGYNMVPALELLTGVRVVESLFE